jgi:hypothetical protein
MACYPPASMRLILSRSPFAITTLLVAPLIAVALMGCDSVTCGVGTHEESGQCVPNVLIECGEGTRYQNGWCLVEDVAESDTGAAPDTDPSDGRIEVR